MKDGAHKTQNKRFEEERGLDEFVYENPKGNYGEAMKIFEEELGEFRKICDVKTIYMHGKPLSRWTNKDVWDKYGFENIGIIGEPYLSIDFDRVAYFTDTGRMMRIL